MTERPDDERHVTSDPLIGGGLGVGLVLTSGVLAGLLARAGRRAALE